jgi:hypothetical protein
MNPRIERVMNSENLGARIVQNGALDQNIWALVASRAKRSFLKVMWQFWNFLSGWRVLAQKTGALTKFDDFSGGLWNF